MGWLASRWRHLNIPARLVGVSSAVLILSSTLVVATHINSEIERERDELADRAEEYVEFLVPAIAEQAVIGDYTAIDRMLQSRSERPSVESLAWVDSAGNAIRRAGKREALSAPRWFAALADIPVVERSREVVVGGAPYGRVTARVSPVSALNTIWVESVEAIELMITATGVLVAMLLLVVSRALRPLFALARGAARLGAGDYACRVEEDGPPEMKATATAFNSMAANLERAMMSLREGSVRNRLLAAIVQQSRDAIVTTDLDGRITSWNQAAENIFGHTAEEIIGRPITIIHTFHASAEVSETLTKIQSGRSQCYETRRVTKDGAVVAIAVSVSPQFDDQGRHIGEISIIRDVTERSRAEEALREEQERLRVTLDSIGDCVIRTDEEGSVEYLNPVAQRMTGWTSEEARGRMLDEVMPVVRETDGSRVTLLAGLVEGTTDPIRSGADLVLAARDGVFYPIEHTTAPIRGRTGEVSGLVVAFRDVGESRRLASQLSWQASHDALTGLLNRRDFERRLEELVESAGRRGTHHALLCLDLDQFKVVNDTCGHVAGDEMLRQISSLLQHCLRESDTLARLGGDEFGILLERCGVEQAEVVAEKLRLTLADYRFVWEANTFAVGVSIGIAAIDGSGQTSAAVLGAADAACFSAKDQGRNRIQVHRPDDAELARRHSEMQWVSRITRAIEERRLRLWAQVIAPIRGCADEGGHYEILVRMLDEEGRVVPPMAFIPAAERYNLMPAIDRQVVELALGHIAARVRAHPDRACPRIAINLSGASFSDAAFLGFVTEQIVRSGVQPGHICFEVTETAAIANLSRATRFIAELKQLGCQFSLDDFGSGFSSFAYLKSLPVDFLKIDGSFVKDMAADPIDCAMVEAVNKLGHVMGIRTIAEFVENDLTLGMLKTIGVDFAQGYGVGRPAPIEDIICISPMPAAPGVQPELRLARA